MRHFSQELRQSVYEALLSAESAASMHQMLSRFGDQMTDDIVVRDQMRHISEVAYSAAAHAWTAMIALASNNLPIAQKAAQEAADAEATIMMISQDLLPPGNYISARQRSLEQTPDEKALYRRWDDFCCSLPSPYPVSETMDSERQNRAN